MLHRHLEEPRLPRIDGVKMNGSSCGLTRTLPRCFGNTHMCGAKDRSVPKIKLSGMEAVEIIKPVFNKAGTLKRCNRVLEGCIK